MILRSTLLTLAVCTSIVGCDRKATGERETADPSAAFKTLSAAFVTHAKQAFDKERAWDEAVFDGSTTKRTLGIYADPEIDVRKTDSLVSPFLGTLKLTVIQLRDDGTAPAGVAQMPLLLTFALQEGKWTLKSAVIRRYSRYDGGRDLKEADVMTPNGYGPFIEIRQRLRTAAERAGGA